MLTVAVRSFIRLCRNHKTLFFITFLSMVCAMAGFLVCQERAYYLATQSANDLTTLAFSFACEDSDALMQAYERLIVSPDLPPIRNLTLSNGTYAGVHWDFDLNDGVYYTPYGRFFTEQEMKEGSDVALLGTGAIARLSAQQIDRVWETPFDIGGETMMSIGSYHMLMFHGNISVDEMRFSAFTAAVSIPLKTFLRLGLNATFLRCEFSEPLTETQVDALRQLVSGTAGAYAPSYPLSGREFWTKSYLSNSSGNTVIMVLAILTMIQVLLHWLRSEFERYRIYLICGAKRSHIAGLLSLQIVFLVTLSYFAAWAAAIPFNAAVSSETMRSLPVPFIAVFYVLLLLLVLAAVHVKAARLIWRGKLLEK